MFVLPKLTLPNATVSDVPTDCPIDLYYRCGAPHGAMGNACYIMEATEPSPVKVGVLPVLKTSTWNDRDYAGIGTNKSVIHFGSGELEGGANTTFLKVANNSAYDISGTTTHFAYEAWINRTDTITGENITYEFRMDGMCNQDNNDYNHLTLTGSEEYPQTTHKFGAYVTNIDFWGL